MDQMPFRSDDRADRPSLGREADLAQALAARICHDLVSPVGAVVNGVDLVRELGGAAGGEELEMIATSARRAADLLAFHRLSFGVAGPDSRPVDRASLAAILRGHLEGPRIAVTVDGLDGPPLPRGAARAVALLGLCARGLVGLRGRVALALGPGAVWPVSAAAEGYDAARKAALLARLAGPAGATEPQEVEFGLLPLWAETAGARVSARAEDGRALLWLQPA